MLSADTYNLWFAPLPPRPLGWQQSRPGSGQRFLRGLAQGQLHGTAAGCGRARCRPAAAGQVQSRLRDLRRRRLPPSASRRRPKSRRSPRIERNSHHAELNFNPKNTFDTFVVGNNNNFAYAAALAVAQAPGKSYNPLFLYGGVGLGKTHLLHAIGQHVASHKKGARVAYVSSEKFTNEYIDAIQNNQLVRFRKKYRQTDVLADRRHPVPRRQGAHSGGILPHLQRPARGAQADRADLRPAGQRNPEPRASPRFPLRMGPGHRPAAAGRRDAPGHSEQEGAVDGRDACRRKS